MPISGLMGREFGFSKISDGKTVTVSTTIEFSKAYVFAEIAMAEVAMIDITDDLFEAATNSVICGVSNIVSNGQSIAKSGESMVSADNVTKITFYATKSGYISGWFRFLISFWS